MAVTKTHPIQSTLKAAIDYICNPEKTDGKLLVSSYGCAAETADIEFSWTRRHAIDKGTHLGRHLIQAFEPGEVTPEEAHEIGMQLAKEILGGKYEFVLTTHIDKNHIHNHLIFNAVSFTDYKHYHSNKRSYHYIRRTSDRICREHGLSVIVPGKDKGKSYIEHQAAQAGTSYKAALKKAIDRLIPGSANFEDLLLRLQREGYEIKRGKYVSCRAPGQERFTRMKTLGVDYTEEIIASRIAGGSRPSRRPNLFPVQVNIRAVLLFIVQSFPIVIFAAVCCTGQGMRASANAILVFEESHFLLIRMVCHEERIDTAFSSGETASAGHGGVDLILGNKVLDDWHLGKL